MNRRVVAWWLASYVLLGAIHGCAGPVRYMRTVDESSHRFVRLEARYGHGEGYGYDGSAMRFTHPIVLSEMDWDRILKSIRVQPRKRFPSIGAEQPSQDAAFTESERQYLARHVAEAFSMARPDEWVVFCLSRQRDEAAALRGGPGVTEMTSGGFFVEGGLLRLVLANYRYAVSMPIIQEQIRDDPLRPAGDTLYELVSSRHQTARPVGTINTGLDLTKPLRTQLSEMAIDYLAFLAIPDEPAAQVDVPQAGKPVTIEDRLRSLQRLWEQGLITEEEYRLKRQKLLDEL